MRTDGHPRKRENNRKNLNQSLHKTNRYLRQAFGTTGNFLEPHRGAFDNPAQTVHLYYVTKEGTKSEVKIRTIVAQISLCSLSALAQPVITQEPQSLVRLSGRHTDFTVVADGAQPLEYQWRFDGREISGARGPTLHLTAAPSRAGMYQVVVRDVAGQQRISVPAELEVKPRPRVTLQPRSAIVQEFGTAVFEVQLNDSGPYTKIVWHNSNPLEGSHEIPDGLGFDVHSTRLEIPNCLNAPNYNGIYWITVENEVGHTASRKVRLKVVSPPQLYSGPEDRTVPGGASVSFSVSVVPDNAGVKRYQWYKNGQPVPSGTSRVLRLSRVQATHQGNYHCIVSSVGGTVESNDGTLTVF